MTTEKTANGLHGKVVQIAPPVADRVAALEAGQGRIEAMLAQLVGQGKPATSTKAARVVAETATTKLSQTAGAGDYPCTYDKPSKGGRWHVFRTAEGVDIIANVYIPLSANPKARKVVVKVI